MVECRLNVAQQRGYCNDTDRLALQVSGFDKRLSIVHAWNSRLPISSSKGQASKKSRFAKHRIYVISTRSSRATTVR